MPLLQHDDIQKNISPFYIKVGTVSPELQCEVGTNGHLFLTRGSNNVLSVYDHEYGSKEVEESAEKWINLFKERRDFCSGIGARFSEVVIPDKLSVMRGQYDGMGSSPSPLLQVLEYKINQNIILRAYRPLKKIGFSNAFRKTYLSNKSEGGNPPPLLFI
ncbi:MAG: hypothetical protein ABF931_11415 [Acetobacter pasteurianus]